MRKEIKKLITEAMKALQKAKTLPDFEMPEILIDYPKNEKFGEYSSNIAMVLAKEMKKNPMEIANQIVELLNGQIAKGIKNPSPALPFKKGESKISPFEKGGLRGIFAFEKIEVVAPGYLNFYLSEKYLQEIVKKINAEKNNFGNSDIGRRIKINNEFISANPTGPLHLGNGRGGFFGDCLSNVLKKVGYDVAKEYYVNDAGEQVAKLGHSVLKDSEAVYTGDYIDELNKKYKKISDINKIGEKSAEDILKNIIKKTTKEKMQIEFDEWVSEKKIQDGKFTEQAIKLFEKKGLIYETENALWLKTTEFGDDKDRVLVKKDEQKTYFASDCGYILNKKERSFEKIIEIWGADHHGYVNRFRAAAEIIGFKKEQIKFIIVQLVRLVKDGKEVRMSKRAGNVVYIDDLIDEVGHDVARFFFLMYSPDTHMNFDLGLAKEQSEKNPVFYVQYAHARICSILVKAEEINIIKKTTKNKDLASLAYEKELELIKELNKFPELVEEIAESYAVHKLPQYAIKLADKFHSFYNDCKVLDEDNLGMTLARLELVKAVKIVLEETLSLIGVGAPEKM